MTWLFVLMLACAGKSVPSVESEPEVHAPTEVEATAPVTPEPIAKPSDAVTACMETCTDRRRTEAIAWEQIELECALRCEGRLPSLEAPAGL